MRVSSGKERYHHGLELGSVLHHWLSTKICLDAECGQSRTKASLVTSLVASLHLLDLLTLVYGLHYGCHEVKAGLEPWNVRMVMLR